ncbi:hypothetical protein, partial [Noviherbaspirillum sp.]|uniref:hypothetical protein n=1 Tax=Noviherbaspirillum sp. TaxID=1926288 RepID=UPI002FDF64B0
LHAALRFGKPHPHASATQDTAAASTARRATASRNDARTHPRQGRLRRRTVYTPATATAPLVPLRQRQVTKRF